MNQHHAKYTFFYLLSLLALVFVAVSVGIVSFQLINRFLFDALSVNTDQVSNEALRFAISALIIAAPLFYVASNLIKRGLKSGELSPESPVRRWLTYFILLISSLVVVGSLIALVNNFLSGEATWRSVLKIITVLFLGAIVFSFYFQDIKKKANANRLLFNLYFYFSLVLVVASFVTAVFLVESPKVARAKRLDQLLVNNISSVESLVNTYYDHYQKLPDDLNMLKQDKFLSANSEQFLDPETKAEIEYNKKGETDFELCAVFRFDNTKSDNRYYTAPSVGANVHGAGRQCFSGNLWNKEKVIK